MMTPENLAAIRERVEAMNGPLCDPEGQAMSWPGKSGGCAACDARIAETLEFPDNFSRPFIVCPQCGNKRCPKAFWHGNMCSGSNDPGQRGRFPRAEFIAHSREDVPALLAEVERLRGEADTGAPIVLSTLAARDRWKQKAQDAEARLGHLASSVEKVTPCACSAQRARADTLQARLDKVRALHVFESVETGGGDAEIMCAACHYVSADDETDPCPTIQALDGGGQ